MDSLFFPFKERSVPIPDVHEVARYRGRGRHFRAYKMSAAAPPLPAFKVPNGSPLAALPRFKSIRVHPQAHAAAGFTPIKTGFAKDTIKPLSFRDSFDLLRTGHHHRVNRRSDFATFDHSGGSAQVLYS